MWTLEKEKITKLYYRLKNFGIMHNFQIHYTFYICVWEYQLIDFLTMSIHKTIKCNSIDGSLTVLLWNGISKGTALKLPWESFLIRSEFREINYNFTYSYCGLYSKELLSSLTSQQQIFISTIWGITRTHLPFPQIIPNICTIRHGFKEYQLSYHRFLRLLC